MPRRASQPIVRRTAYGSLKNGVCTQGIQTAATGRETTVEGINRKAITLHRNSLSAIARGKMRYGLENVLAAPSCHHEGLPNTSARGLPSIYLAPSAETPASYDSRLLYNEPSRGSQGLACPNFAMVRPRKRTHARKNQAQIVWPILEDVTGGTSQSHVTIEEKSGAIGRTVDAGWL